MKKWLVIAPPWLWMVAFVALPLIVVLGIAVSGPAERVPPIEPFLRWEGGLVVAPVWDNLSLVFGDPFYLDALVQSLLVAGACGLLCLMVGLPMALGLCALPARWQPAVLMLVLLPFWTGFLLRMGAWIGILRDSGWINSSLVSLGIIEAPLPLLYSWPALMIGMVHAYLPFAVLPLYAALSKRDLAVEEAAADLGATPARVFWSVTLPVAAPGAVAAFLLVFIPAVGEYVIPELLGPPEATLIGRVLFQEFFQNRDWPVASSLAVALLALLIGPILLFQRVERKS